MVTSMREPPITRVEVISAGRGCAGSASNAMVAQPATRVASIPRRTAGPIMTCMTVEPPQTLHNDLRLAVSLGAPLFVLFAKGGSPGNLGPSAQLETPIV